MNLMDRHKKLLFWSLLTEETIRVSACLRVHLDVDIYGLLRLWKVNNFVVLSKSNLTLSSYGLFCSLSNFGFSHSAVAVLQGLFIVCLGFSSTLCIQLHTTRNTDVNHEEMLHLDNFKSGVNFSVKVNGQDCLQVFIISFLNFLQYSFRGLTGACACSHKQIFMVFCF